MMNPVDPNSPVYVLSNNSTLVAAVCLANPQGGFVTDPNTQTVTIYQKTSTGLPVQVANPLNYLIVPADFTVASALNFASQIRGLLGSPNPETAYLAMALAFKPGGSQDLQRNYDGQTWSGSSGMFVLAFKDAASWYLGFVAQQAGIPVAAAIDGGGLYNYLTGKGFQVDPNDIKAINGGAAFGTSLPAGQSFDTDSVTVTTAGVTIDNDSATIRGNNNQVSLSGLNDTVTFTGSNDTFTLTGPGLSGTLTSSGNATITVGQNGNTLVQTGNGDTTLTSTIPGLTLDLGTGNNFVGSVAQGTIVNAQSSGVNQFVPSADELITGSTPQDQIVAGNNVLHGAVGQVGSQDPWVVAPNQVKYGFNQQGDLVIQTPYEAAFNNGMTFIQGYVGGPGVPYADQTDGILVSLAQITSSLLIDLTRPFIEDIPDWFKLGNELYYTATGKTIFNADPLVFDLTGAGINLTSLSSASPMLDMEGTGFAMHTGWVAPNDGILVLEQPGQDGTPNVTEMFGDTGDGTAGFAALAQYDVNGTGVLDASDPIWSQLMIWVDTNGNGQVDPGELKTLQQAGITSINLNAAAQSDDTDNGNTIVATSTFTFADGSTGNVDQVDLNINTFNTQYLGDTTVSVAAAAMPDLKGYGTLTDLQVAMTLDPSLIDVVNANLPNLDTENLTSLVQAAMPIFVAWAQAVELPDANGDLQVVNPADGNTDVPVLMSMDADGNVTVMDFAYETKDQADNTYYELASGTPVLDSNGNIIAEPTLAQVLAQTPPSGETWVDFSGGEVGFIERYYGQPFPIDQASSNPSGAIAAMSDLMTGAYTVLDLEAVRLAMQGPLAQYFPGISYDVTTDSFAATTNEQLSPMYEAIFAAAPSDAAGAMQWLTNWLPIINIVLGDFARSNGVEVTYGYQFASMVHAYEQTNLPLTIEQTAAALGVPPGEVIEGGGTITGPNSPSIYYLHGGDQTVTAGIGLNNFVMGGTFGQDSIIDDEPEGHSDESVLWFTNVASTDITATRDGLNLILSVNGTDEQVTVENEFNGVEESFTGSNLSDNWGVAQIEFSDGVLWDMPNIAMAVSQPEPNEPTILGTPGMDVLNGGVGGNNFLSGGDGSDIYMFGLGYGHDTISVNRSDPFNDDIDTVAFGAGITISGLTFSRQGASDDLSIIVNSTGDTLTILGQFAADYSLFGPLWLDQIEEFAFADGSVYSWQQIDQMMDAQATGTPAIYGFDDFNDVLDPGTGVHYLSGGNGVKTYIFDFGYNFDTVQENVTNILADNGDNTIEFNSDVTEQDVTFSLAGNSLGLIITLNDGSTMLIDGEFALSSGTVSFNLVQNFQFADGTVYTWTQILQQLISAEEAQSSVIYGSDYADVLDPGPNGGFHYLSGGNAGNGVDTYVFGYGYGSETIDVNWTNLLERGGEVVSFTANVSESDVRLSAMGQDLVIQLAGAPTDSATILGQFSPWFYEDGVTSFAFADGTTYSVSDIVNMAFNGAGGGATVNVSDAVNLLRSPATFQCGPGDVFIGDGAVPFTTAGNTFDFNPGDGFNVIVDPQASGIADDINFGAGITESMVQTYLLGTNMIFTFAGSTDQIVWMDNGGYTPSGNVFDAIGSVTFADGTTWSTADLLAGATAAPALSIAQNGNDYQVDYNIDQGYAYVDLPYEQQGTTTTLDISGLDPDDVDVQRVGFLDANGNAQAAAILISAAGSTAGGLLIEGPQYSTDLQFDQIVFDDGTVWTKAQVEQMLVDQAAASTGNTEVEGFAGNLTIYAGSGNDVLEGGTGNNTYVYQQGDGFAQIVVDKPSGSGYVDTLDFTDIASTDVTLSRWPGNGINNLLITVDAADGGGQITIENQFGYGGNQANAAINDIAFSDGVTWTEQDIESQLIAQEEAQTGPNITVYGFDSADTLSAVAGASTLIGGTGANTYVWNAGNGATWITDQGDSSIGYTNQNDTLLIHGIDPSTVTVTRDPTPGAGNLVLTSPGQAPIILQGQTAASGAVDQVVFDDGTTWDDIQLLIQADGGIATTPNGTTARSFAGASANSTMNGTSSDDVYFWGAGDGDDTIVEGDYAQWQKADTVTLVGLNPGDVTLDIIQGGARDLVITDKATGETLTIVGQFDSASNDDSNSWPGGGTGIELLQFANGAIWEPQQILDNSVYVAAPGDTTLANEGFGNGSVPMEASPGVQDIYGREHIDNTYIWSPGDGSDTIYYGGYGGVDTLRLTGVAEADILLIRAGGTLIVSDTASGESITIPFLFPDQTTDGVGQIVFDDGTVWNSAYINANAQIVAGTGENTLYGPSDPVIFNLLAAGDDYVYGGGNGDTFLDGPQSGNDTINESGAPSATNTLRLEGISPSQVVLSYWGNDLYVQRLDSGATTRVINQFNGSAPNSGVEQIVFDDGTVWNQATIQANAGPLTFTWVGTASDTTLTGSGYGNNVFDLGPGGDTVTFGGSGANTVAFDKGDGQAQINVNGANGVIQMASDIADNDVYLQTDNNGDLFIRLRDSSDSITVYNDLQTHWWGVSSQITAIDFADGTSLNLSPPTFTWIGTATNTTLNGSDYGNNTFDLGPGGDTVNFDYNNTNTLVFDKGDGQVQVNVNGGSGIVQMAADIADDDVILQADNNGDLTIALLDDPSDSITLYGDLQQHWWGVSSLVTAIDFADGTSMNINPPTFTWIGTATNTTLNGSNYGNNTFDLGPGGDTVNFSYNGTNTLVFGKGDGQVQVNVNGDVGIVQMAADVSDDDVIFQADNNYDLTLALRDDPNDSITLYGDLQQHWWGVSSLVTAIDFADGTSLNISSPNFTWIGSASDTTLTGSVYGGNIFDLGPGGDTVNFANNGRNVVVFDKGNGAVQINLDGGTGVLQVGADIADNDVIFQADNNGDLTIALADDPNDSVTIAGDLYQNWWGVSSALQQIDFADGTTLNVAMTGYGQGQPPTFTWLGTASNTTLTGSGYGNNTFDLAAGGDTVNFANNGGNTIVFDKGDGAAQVNLNSGTGVLKVGADIADNDVIFQADNNGDLTVALADDPNDSVTVANDLYQNWWGVSSALQQVDFADGTTLNVAMTGYGQGQPPSFTWVGTASNTTLTGSSYGNNTFDLGASGDAVNFANNGGNTVVFDKGVGHATVNLDGGTGVVQVAADIADDDVILQADNSGDLTIALRDDTSDGVTVLNDLTQNWYGISSQLTQINFADGSVLNVGSPGYNRNPPPTFTYIATGNSQTLTGSIFGNNLLQTSYANDVLIGGSGSDTLQSTGHDNTLIAGTGSDTLTSTGTDDTLIGNADGSTLDASSGVGAVAAYALDNMTINLATGQASLNFWSSDTLVGIASAEALGSGDTLIGGNGPSTLISDAAGNTLQAGSGPATALYAANDVTVDLATGTASINGGSASDTLIGIVAAAVTGSNGTLIGGSGATTLISNAAGNTLQAGTGATTALYEANNITVNLATGTASVNGSSMSDVLVAIDSAIVSGNDDTIIAGSGADTLIAQGSNDTLFGNAAGSTLQGTAGAVAAYTANDLTVNLATGTASINGSGTSDTLIGIDAAIVSGSNDTIVAGNGAGTLIAEGSNDTLFGNAAGSTLQAAGVGTVATYTANDLTVDLATGTASINGSGTSDTLLGINAVAALGSGDTLVGGSGTTTLISNAAGNTLEAGTGSTVALYALANVTVNLAAETASVNGSGISDTLVGINAAAVSAGHDTIVAGSGAQILSATGSADSLIAGSGADTLAASGTNDTLFGNAAGSTLNGAAGTATVAAYTVNNVTVNLAAGTAAVNGASASDTLVGINVAKVLGTGDTIVGGAGAETLSSSGSNNTLIAGSGLDTLSSSGTADVLISNASGNVLKSTGTLTVASYALSNATINLAAGTAKLNGASTGDTLTGIKRASVTGNNDTLIAGSGAQVLSATGSGDTLIGGSGTSTLISNAGGNTLEAGTGAATASYTGNGLTVDLATGTATVNGSGVSDTLIGITRVSVTGNNDTLMTDGTTDTLTVVGNNDTLSGGAAVSTLLATGSGDVLQGGSAATTLISNAGGNTLQAGTGRAVASYSLSGLTVNLNTDTASINGSGVSDTLVGIVDVVATGSDDTLIADGGSDTLSLSGSGGTLIGGSGTATLTATGSNDTLEGGSGSTTLISNAGGNTLVAGSGLTVAQYATANVAVNLAAGTATVNGAGVSDTLTGIVNVTVTGTGATVTGGAGADTLTAKGRNDTLVGGSGTGTLTTTSSIDLLVGGAGTTTLVSNANGNTLEAGSGKTVATYALSNLTVDLGAGDAVHGTTSDTLVGITDVAVTGGTDTLIAGAADETLSASGSNDTLYTSSAGGDDLQVTSGSNDTFVATVGGNTLDGDGHTTADYTGNGLIIDLATGTATVNGSSAIDGLIGIVNVVVTGNNDTVIADDGTDTLSVVGSGDTLIGGLGLATLSATGSGDVLIGGAAGTATLIGAAAGDTLEAGTGKTIADYAASSIAINLATGTAAINGSSTSDTLVGITDVVTSGDNDTLTAGSGTDILTANGNGATLSAGSGNDTLTSTGSGATLIAGSGTDRLVDSGGGGSYQYGRGDGNATIVNGASGATSPSNQLNFGSGITDENLWFVQSGNNLQIDLMGTNDHVTVSGWFASAGKDLQEITAGGLEIDSQVSQLVQAMATYSADNHGFNPTSSSNTQAPNDPTLQAAIAAAWHH
jgi:Ca2+-binding RTX toxin-like protein